MSAHKPPDVRSSISLETQYVLRPRLIESIGDVTGKHVLELGTKDMYWLNLLRGLGAASCRGMRHDTTLGKGKTIQRLLSSGGISIDTGDITQPFVLERPYDIVFLEGVLSRLPSKEAIAGTLQNARRLIHHAGKLVVNDIGPMSVAYTPSPRGVTLPYGFNYFAEGSMIGIPRHFVDVEFETTQEQHTHWRTETYGQAIIDAGFRLVDMNEIQATPAVIASFPDALDTWAGLPMYLTLVGKPNPGE